MKALCLPALGAAMSALLILVPASTAARDRPMGINVAPPPHHGGMHGFRVPLIIVQPETVIEREAPPPPAAVPLPEQAQEGTQKQEEPREPYVIGRSYASLPGGCRSAAAAGRISPSRGPEFEAPSRGVNPT